MLITNLLYLWSFVIIIYEFLQVLVPLHKHFWLSSLNSINKFLCSIGMKLFFSQLYYSRGFGSFAIFVNCWLVGCMCSLRMKSLKFFGSFVRYLLPFVFIKHEALSFWCVHCLRTKRWCTYQGALQVDSIIHDQNHVSSSP